MSSTTEKKGAAATTAVRLYSRMGQTLGSFELPEGVGLQQLQRLLSRAEVCATLEHDKGATSKQSKQSAPSGSAQG